MEKLTPYMNVGDCDVYDLPDAEYRAYSAQHWCLHEAHLGKELRDKFPVRENVTLIGEVTDNESCYSFDDYALCEYEGRFYLFNASGCSCPSHEETACLVYEADRIDELAHKMREEMSDYGVPKRQWADFEELFEKARSLENE